MSPRLFHLIRVALLVGIPAAMTENVGSARALPDGMTQAGASITLETPLLTQAPYEVRLRKLHLVRPDLIPFPIFFEVYC